MNNSFSEWEKVLVGVSRGSTVDPLFKIFRNDIFLFLQECDLASFSDGSTIQLIKGF